MNCSNHPDRVATTMCNKCGKPLCIECRVLDRGEVYCNECLFSRQEKGTGQGKFTLRSSFVAAMLSMFMSGLGQIYNGEFGKGILLFLTSGLIIPWIYSIFDAYITAEKINKGEIERPYKPGCVASMIVCGCLIPLLIFIMAIGSTFITMMRGARMEKTFVPGGNITKSVTRKMMIGPSTNAKKVAQQCINNLRYLSQLKDMYVQDYGLKMGDPFPEEDNNGIDDGDGIPDVLEEYIEITPRCPAGGRYSINPVGEYPTCSIGDNRTPDPSDDHIYRGDEF